MDAVKDEAAMCVRSCELRLTPFAAAAFWLASSSTSFLWMATSAWFTWLSSTWRLQQQQQQADVSQASSSKEVEAPSGRCLGKAGCQ
jgi:hypothetical protein